jgi:hypothetical protein
MQPVLRVMNDKSVATGFTKFVMLTFCNGLQKSAATAGAVMQLAHPH